MRATVRQTFALAQLILRYWARAGLPNPVRSDHSRRASGAILRVAFVLLFVNWGYRVGISCTDKIGDRREAAIAWLLFGLFGASIVGSAHGRLPGVRAVAPPTSSPILDPLPLGTPSRTIIGLLERLTLYALAIAALTAAIPEARVRAAIVAVGLTTSALLVGDAFLRLARVVVSPMLLARFGVAIVFVQLPFLIVLASAPSLAGTRATILVAFALPAARAAITGEAAVVTVGALAAICVAAALAIRTAERVGYDRIDVVPDRRLAPVNSKRLTIDRVEGVLAGREPGGRFALPFMLLYTTFASGGALAVAWSLRHAIDHDTRVKLLVRIAIFVATFGGFVLVNSRATRMIARDTVARAFLAPLPIAPHDMLRGKARALRFRALLVAAPALMLLFVPASSDLRVEIVIRLGTVLAAIALAAGATVSVAFLTEGLGAVRSSLGSFNLETLLVALPLFAVAAPPYRWYAFVGVGALALLAFEARRAALACVRWMDDGDDFLRETPVWRALLVFSSFYAAQSLTLRALAFTPLQEATTFAISYGVGAVALVALTLQARRGLRDLRVLPSLGALVPAVLVGAACGMAVLFYGRLLRRFEADLPYGMVSPDATPALLVGLLIVAPIAEEVFFRGWLQSAIEGELGDKRRWLAPLLAAFASAGISEPLMFAPLFVAGVAIGFLYARTRSVGAATVAHAVYGAFALFAFY